MKMRACINCCVRKISMMAKFGAKNCSSMLQMILRKVIFKSVKGRKDVHVP